MHALHALLCRFTLSIAVELPDTAAREDIIMTHLRQHCEQHILGKGAVNADLMQVEPLQKLRS
jgi:SpoVK/Ycf46/Vps4 family AAA+-type ATPase